MIKINGEDKSLALNIICKDETDELERAIVSCKDYLDEIVVGWNGTNPETEAILKKHNCNYFTFKWNDDFGEARNLVIDHTKSDFIIWLDADDVVMCPEKIPVAMDRTFKHKKVGAIWTTWHYDFDKHGRCTCILKRERIFRRGWYRWQDSLHETLAPIVDCQMVEVDGVYIEHRTTPERIHASAKRNLVIIMAKYDQEHKDGKIDPRTCFSLAKSLQAIGMDQEAVPVLKEYLSLSNWDGEKVFACTRLSNIYRTFKMFDHSEAYDLEAIRMKPDYPNGYFNLAYTKYYTNKYDDAISLFTLGLSLPRPQGILPYDPFEYTGKPIKHLAFALFYTEQFQLSLEACEKALAYEPDNEILKDLMKKDQELLKQMSLSEHMKEIKNELEAEGDQEKLKHFVQALPAYMKDAPVFVRMKNKYLGQNKANRVVIYCGYQDEPWSPAKIKTGVGGSEEAVINMANELTKLGWLVDVFNYCDKAGNYDGVEYMNYWEYDPNVPCDVFIAWRNNAFIEYAPKESKANFVWCHDVQRPNHWIPERTEKIDKVFVLSQFHRTNLPDIPDEKFFITRNGINPEQFPLALKETDLKRDPFKCIYASSPDRGLAHLLQVWGEIKKAVPEATLDIYYGFTKHADQANKDNEQWHRFKAQIQKDIQQPGITWKGMVGHMELADAFLNAGLWVYPCHFDEISCITAMKAQASGCIPVYTDVGALPETVKYGIYSGNPDDPKHLKSWTTAVIELLQGKHKISREQMRAWAVGFYGWDQVALSWSELFKTTIALKGEIHVEIDKDCLERKTAEEDRPEHKADGEPVQNNLDAPGDVHETGGHDEATEKTGAERHN